MHGQGTGLAAIDSENFEEKMEAIHINVFALGLKPYLLVLDRTRVGRYDSDLIVAMLQSTMPRAFNYGRTSSTVRQIAKTPSRGQFYSLIEQLYLVKYGVEFL